jgi:hypothetical protein
VQSLCSLDRKRRSLCDCRCGHLYLGETPQGGNSLTQRLVYATAHLWYAWHLILMGQNSEGLCVPKTQTRT